MYVAGPDDLSPGRWNGTTGSWRILFILRPALPSAPWRGIIKDSTVATISDAIAPALPSGALDAVLLLKKTGVPLATWSRSSIPEEVVSVMAATMLGSIETIAGAFGGPRVESLVVEMDVNRMVVSYVNSSAFLVLIAPKSTKVSSLRKETRRIAACVRHSGEDDAAELKRTSSGASSTGRLTEVLRANHP